MAATARRRPTAPRPRPLAAARSPRTRLAAARRALTRIAACAASVLLTGGPALGQAPAVATDANDATVAADATDVSEFDAAAVQLAQFGAGDGPAAEAGVFRVLDEAGSFGQSNAVALGAATDGPRESFALRGRTRRTPASAKSSCSCSALKKA